MTTRRTRLAIRALETHIDLAAASERPAVPATAREEKIDLERRRVYWPWEAYPRMMIPNLHL